MTIIIKKLEKNIEEGIELSKLLREEQRYRFVPDTPPEKYLNNLNVFSGITDILHDMNNVIDFINTDVPHIIPLIRVSNIISYAQRRTISGKAIAAHTFEKAVFNVEKLSWWKDPPDCEADFHTRSAIFYFHIELKKYFRSVRRLQNLPEKTTDKLFLTNTVNRYLPIAKIIKKGRFLSKKKRP